MNKPKTLLVRATHPDRPCPMMRRHPRWDPKTKRDRTLIYHDEPREVENVSFYRRAIRRGDLEEVNAPAPKRTPKPKRTSEG
jgi:5-methylcytosine-specific restriction endonuclease McrA